MELFRGVAFFFLLYLLQRASTSFVRLNDNGYEDVIIAIDPGVQEDLKIIEQIKEMVTTASTYLFEATQKRFFFKNVSILIPESWSNSPQYRRPKYESYTHADVRVAPPAFPGSDEPFTRQFTECEQNAEYIHLTPDFVLGRKQNEYGPSGRLFVHEWAHLRWGVFDEYNEEQPFYAASSKKVEATRCSLGISGKNQAYRCQGGSCTYRSCRKNSTTNLYEKDCQFFPDKQQSEKASIMFMQSIDSVTEFCNKDNHNREAPSLQNLKCDYRSAWEVISNSEDFRNSTPLEALPSPPIFSLLKISERTVCLVLDISGSMSLERRLERMNQAAKYFLLQIVEDGAWVGMVHFDHNAYIKHNLTEIKGSAERNKLVASLPPVTMGGTSICSGIRAAFKVFEELTSMQGSEIVLLTDGEDSNAGSCIDEVKNSGTIVHFIALGPNYEKAVIQMTSITGGKYFYSSDNAQNNGLIDAFGSLTSENVDVTQKSLQLESRGVTMSESLWINDTVVIDSTVGKDTFFLITWNGQTPPGISLWDPKGTEITNFTVDTVSKMAYLSIPEIAQVGIWTYNLEAKVKGEILTITITSRAANSSVPPITVNAKMNKDTSSFPSPMIVYAEVLQGFVPILGANVTAIIESNSGHVEHLELLDNGAGADSFKDDGVYSRYFMAYTENGTYNLKVRVHGGTNSARRSSQRPLNRAAYIPGWVVNGEIQGNPPRPEVTGDTQTVLENFSRIASGGAFVVSEVPALPLPDLYPPSQITDLHATFNGPEIQLMWTAPGDDYDIGRVQQYIIRISENLTDLRDNFDGTLQVNTTDLIPNDANSKETFAFKPENISEENATYIFIAIKSIDKSNQKSKLSNIAQVALFIPQADVSPDENPNPNPDESPKSGVNITTVVVSVVGSIVAVCIIVSVTVCILKKRSSRRPATTF